MALDPARARRLILLAAVVGLILRLAFGLLYWVGKPLTHDEREYLALARSLSAGRGFTYDSSHATGTAQQFGRAPGYPLFLAAIGAGRGEHETVPARVKIAQSLVGAGVVALIGWLAMRTIGSRAGALAATVAAIHPPLISICAYVFSETLYSLLALATVLLFNASMERAAVAGRERDARIRIAMAGLLTGAAILVRPVMLFFIPLAVVWMIWRRHAALAALFLVLAAASVLPWTVRNLRVHDRFVLVASEGGVTFWTGNHPLARGDGDLAANPDIKVAELEFRRAHPGLSAEQLEPLYYRDALRYIADHPVWWAGLLARKAFYTVVPIGPSYTLHSRKYVAASVTPYVLLLPFAIAGAMRLVRHGRPPVGLFLLAGSVVLAGLVFFPQERFRIPVIDPTLIVCAAALSSPRGARVAAAASANAS
jgi:4-amino-4-deoxy-L-arabinose transferase-like glycosyltransferase